MEFPPRQLVFCYRIRYGIFELVKTIASSQGQDFLQTGQNVKSCKEVIEDSSGGTDTTPTSEK